MRSLRREWRRCLGAIGFGRKDADFALELESHIAMQTEDNIRAGMRPDEARGQARLKFGGVAAAREALRDQKGLHFFETLLQDLHYAARTMAKSPGFTMVAVLCLALGIRANTAIFSLVDALMSRSAAVAELDTLFRRGLTQGLNPPTDAEKVPHLVLDPAENGLNSLRSRFSEPLYILLGATGLVLLIACANVATLLLARASARQREMSIRLAVGASRPRLVRQFLTESLLLASVGGVLGLTVAWLGSPALRLWMTPRGERLPFDGQLNLAVLGFSAAVAMLTGVVFGLAPALRATRVDPAQKLKETASAITARFSLGKVLVVAQVAFSLLLLFAAGLFLRTLNNLEAQEFGFDRNNLLIFALDSRRTGASGGRLAATYSEVLRKLQSLPGVRFASASGLALLSGWTNNSGMTTDGPQLAKSEANSAQWNLVGPGFSRRWVCGW